MKRIACLLGCLLLAGSVNAQYLPLPATNPQTAPAAQTVIRVAPHVTDAAEIDEHALNQKLREKNAELQRRNAALGEQLVSLKASLEAYTSKGGSAVHAYCEDSSARPVESARTRRASARIAPGNPATCANRSAVYVERLARPPPCARPAGCAIPTRSIACRKEVDQAMHGSRAA